MKARRVDQRQPLEGDQPKASAGVSPASKALPKGIAQAETGQPGAGQGRIDVTGIVPEDIRIDPDITEGHPGYEESGDSEIIPPQRLTGEGTPTEEGEAS